MYTKPCTFSETHMPDQPLFDNDKTNCISLMKSIPNTVAIQTTLLNNTLCSTGQQNMIPSLVRSTMPVKHRSCQLSERSLVSNVRINHTAVGQTEFGHNRTTVTLIIHVNEPDPIILYIEIISQFSCNERRQKSICGVAAPWKSRNHK